MRYILEGKWSGYCSSQQRVVHRTVISERRAKQIGDAQLTGILYTDGTWLHLCCRPAKPRERVDVMDSYSSLIDKCLRYGVSSVAALRGRNDQQTV